MTVVFSFGDIMKIWVVYYYRDLTCAGIYSARKTEKAALEDAELLKGDGLTARIQLCLVE